MMKRKFFKINSINWRMPFNYAVIALITALSLGTVMMLVLTSYYNNLEKKYLQINAISMQPIIEAMIYNNTSTEQIYSQLSILSLLTQTQLKILDQQNNIIVDSGQISSMTKVIIQKDENETTVIGMDVNPEELNSALSGVVITKAEDDNGSGNGEEIILSIRSAPMGGYWISDEHQQAAYRVSSQKYIQPILNGAMNLELSNGPAYGSDVLRSVTIAWCLAAIFSGIIAIISGVLISKQVTRPVQSLNMATKTMEQGQLSTRVNLQNKQMDEFSSLANSFNAMAERIEKTVFTLRDFVSDAAHEINTPLTAIKINLELAENESSIEKKAYYIKNAHQNCTRLERLSQSLLDLSRIESNQSRMTRKTISLTNFIHGTSEIYASQAEQNNINFHITLPESEVLIQANEQQLAQAIGNLLENALKFTPENGTIDLSLAIEYSQAIILVCDDGIGVPDEDIPHLFERFHRGRNVNQYPGNGLGLAITKAIIDAHQGTICVIPRESGTCFEVMLPLLNK